MRTNKFLAAVLLVGAAFSALTSCQKDGPQPIYSQIIGVYPVTDEEGMARLGYRIVPDSRIYFCSDNFPFMSLSGGTVTIVPQSEQTLKFMISLDSTSHFSQVSTTTREFAMDGLIEIVKMSHASVDSLKWRSFSCPRQCSDNGTYFSMRFLVPIEDGEYKFNLLFENPARGLYYQSGTYLYCISTDETDSQRFRTSIVEL